MVPENTHTSRMEDIGYSEGEEGLKSQRFLKESMKLNLNFSSGGGVQTPKNFCGKSVDIL